MSEGDLSSGYLIVRRSGVAYELRAGRGEISANKEESVEFLSLADYAGIDRLPLVPLTGPEPGYLGEHIDWWRSHDIDVDNDQAARIKQGQLCQDDLRPEFLGGLIVDFDQARNVHALTDVPDDWDVIEVSRAEMDDSDAVLGYDVAAWNGEFHSYIWSSCTDSWLLPIDRKWLELLNDNLLMDSADHARQLEDYRRASGGDTDDFIPVRISSTLP